MHQEEIRFDRVLDWYRKDEFDSPTRSTIPLLDLIKNGNEMLQEIVHELGIEGEPSYHLEFGVEPPAGRGNPSQTDLWVQTKDQVLGIEAKWTERRYETVETWLKRSNNPDNKRTVLHGWIGCLQQYSSNPLTIEGMKGQVYQMVHRAASVCSCKTNPILAYMLFTEELQPKENSYIYLVPCNI